MEYLFICYPNCSTCKKAESWLKDQGIEFAKRNIKEDNPSVSELSQWLNMSELPIQKFFNTSGKLYRDHDVKTKLTFLSEEELVELLASDGMMVKRPILVSSNKVLVGFKEVFWNQELLK